MSQSHWLVKQEPETYPFDQLLRDQKTRWDGVRNFQARNNLRSMKKGDLVLYYHSGEERAVVGLCEVITEAYPDPTATEGDWSAVDLKPLKKLPRSVPLANIKSKKALANMALVRQSRLSVMTVTAAEFSEILSLSGTSLK
ncbi:MAG: EVE domain-containing protein [Methylacidiphilales bacterium]|nr:EVE domain-containing protein [Candidatus Methylacidiphilales bacterium]